MWGMNPSRTGWYCTNPNSLRIKVIQHHYGKKNFLKSAGLDEVPIYVLTKAGSAAVIAATAAPAHNDWLPAHLHVAGAGTGTCYKVGAITQYSVCLCCFLVLVLECIVLCSSMITGTLLYSTASYICVSAH
jgi:hypothetical protein